MKHSITYEYLSNWNELWVTILTSSNRPYKELNRTLSYHLQKSQQWGSTKRVIINFSLVTSIVPEEDRAELRTAVSQSDRFMYLVAIIPPWMLPHAKQSEEKYHKENLVFKYFTVQQLKEFSNWILNQRGCKGCRKDICLQCDQSLSIINL